MSFGSKILKYREEMLRDLARLVAIPYAARLGRGCLLVKILPGRCKPFWQWRTRWA